MNRAQRKAIISIVMVVTMALSAIVTIPMASRYSNGQAQRTIAEHKGRPGELASGVMIKAVIPMAIAVIGSFVLGMVAGFVAGRLLPPTEAPVRRGRRR